jgi:excisionase family DNA binding protein
MGAAEKFVVLSADELEALLERAARRAISARAADVNEPEFLTTAQVAKLLQTTPRNVRYLATGDGLPSMRVGTDYRFKRSAVLAYMERKK